MHLTLSVILCTKDRPDDLKSCLASILAGKRLPEEIVIVDDGNLELSSIQQMLDKTGIQLQYRRKSPPNLSASRNLAVSLARGDILSFLDDDVILDPNYYLSVMKAFEEDTVGRLAGVTGAIKLNTHPLKRIYLRFFGLESNHPGKVQPWGAVTLVRAGEIQQPIRVDWLSGCNMNFRRWVFQKYHFEVQEIGYIWGEDRDFTYPLGREYLLLALPDATLIHKKSPLSRPSAKNLGRMEIFNLGRFFLEHSPRNFPNTLALGWSFIGIMMKNLFNILHPRKGANSMEQLLGNWIGLLQFLAYLKKSDEKSPQC